MDDEERGGRQRPKRARRSDSRSPPESAAPTPAAVTVLTVEQLAARWKVDVKTVYSAVAGGAVPALRLGRKRVIRIPVAVVQAMEMQGRVLPSENPDGGTQG